MAESNDDIAKPSAAAERQPPVDTSRNGDRPHVVAERHGVGAFGAQRFGVGPPSGAAGGIERVGWPAVVVDQCEEVATHATHVGGRHGQHRAGGDRGIGC
jgi:hypothetical protein